MRTEWKRVSLIMGLAFSVAASSPAFAKTAGYCVECHSKKFVETLDRPSGPFHGENQSVYRMKLDACPGLRSISEEIFYTESRIVKLDEILRAVEQDGWRTDNLRKGVAESAESFSDLREHKPVSIQHVSREASAIRTVLQKVYDRTLQERDESSRRWLIGLGGLFLAGLFVLIGLGYRKLGRMGKWFLAYLVVGSFLSLSACTSSPEPQKKSPGQERLEQSLSLASQITRQMDEAFYQSCLLAEMSREWSTLEPAAAEKGFQLAWRMALAAREKAVQIKPLREVVSEWPDPEKASKGKVSFDTVLDLRDELRNAEGGTWALRVIAQEWIRINPKGGRAALEFATQEDMRQGDPDLRDQRLKSMSEAWAEIDETRSLEVSRAIRDPFLKASALTRLVLSVKDRGKAGKMLQEAWGAGEAVAPSYPRSKVLIQISATAAGLFPQDKNAWLDRVLVRIQGLKQEQLRAFALQELVERWALLDFRQAKRLAMEIPPAYPAERAYALLHLATGREASKAEALTLLKEVSAEMKRISDPFEAQKVKALTALELARIEPRQAFRILPQIEDSFHRSGVLESLALRLSTVNRRKALESVERIPLEPIRERSAVALVKQWMDRDREKVDALYREALQAGMAIADPFPRALILIELGRHWSRIEKDRESGLLELALTSTEKITSPSLRAEAFEALADAWKGSEAVKAHALLGRIDPSFLRARSTLGEVQQWASVDPEMAIRLAEAVPSPYPLERAMAFKEIAEKLSKAQPGLAFDFYEKAIHQVLALPEGSRGRRHLSSLVMEAGRLNREKTLQVLLNVSEPETRDLLLREVGTLWAREDPLFSLRAACEISEGAFRFILYQNVADVEARRGLRLGKPASDQPNLLACYYWGLGREKARKEESQAIPQYEKALHEIRRVRDSRERSYLLAGLVAEWASLDEERALRISEEIPSEFPEPLSYSLLQIGTHLSKWNRKEAEVLFQKALSGTAPIENPGLRGLRFFQIGRQWKEINREKGKEVLKMAASEIRKKISSTGKEDPLLVQILIADLALDPQGLSTLFQKTDSPSLRANVLLEQGKIESKETIEANIKILEKALQYARKARHPRLTGEIALAWHALSPEKGREISEQIESKELLVRTLCQMARSNGLLRKDESKRLLEKATREAILVQGMTEKMKVLKEIAETGLAVDQEQAKVAYRMAYEIVGRASY